MAKPLLWNDLKIGILSVTAILAAAFGVLIFGRVGTLHGKTFTLYISTDGARGVIRGTEVWLDGRKVGLVRGIDFRPASVSAKDRLVLTLKVLRSVQDHVRMDTKVQIRSGTTVIGDQVVYMSSGTAKMRQVAEGDTIRSSAGQADYENASAQMAEAGTELPLIMANVKVLGAQLRSVDGTLGALGVEGSADVRSARARAGRLLARFSESDGTVGLFLDNSELLAARAKRAMAQTDSIRALLASNEHSLGRFRRDSTIVTTISALRAELADLQRKAMSPDGSVGRFRTDSTLVYNLHRGVAALDSLVADMKRHPLRYNPF